MSDGSTARPLERRALAQLVQLCREHARHEGAPWVEYEREARLESLLIDAEAARCWVIDGEGELAGYASASLELSTWDAGRYLHLDCIYLRPPYRGGGLGRGLIAEVVRAAIELGSIHVQWQTPGWNADAVRFYHRLGANSAEKPDRTRRPGSHAA